VIEKEGREEGGRGRRTTRIREERGWEDSRDVGGERRSNEGGGECVG
jgi:hypothetical protein